MAEFIADIGVVMDSKGVKEGVKEINKASAANENFTKKQTKNNGLVSRSFDDANKKAKGLTSTLSSMRGLITTLGIAGLVAGAKKFVNLSGEYKSFNATIKANVDSAEDFVEMQERLIQVAKDTRQPLNSVVSLYQGISPVLREAGMEQAEVARTAELASKAMKIAGGSAEGHKAAMTQLTQGLAAGVLRGEEFNSVLENAPGLAQALAAGLGVPLGALRGLANEGELTTERVVAALEAQGDAIDTAFGRLPVKAGEAWTGVVNAMTLAFGRIDEQLGFGDAVVGTISDIALVIEDFSGRFIGLIKRAKELWGAFVTELGTADSGMFMWARVFLNVLGNIFDFLSPVIGLIGKMLLAILALKAGIGIVTALGAGIVALKGIAIASTAAMFNLSKVVGVVSRAFVALKAIALANPITLSIAAMATAAIVLMKNWEHVVGFFRDLWGDVSDVFVGFKNWVLDIFGDGILNGLKNIVVRINKKIAEVVASGIMTIIEFIKNPQEMLAAAKNTGSEIIDSLSTPFTSEVVTDAAEKWSAKVTGEVVDAGLGIGKESDKIQESFLKMTDGLNLQLISLESGAEAARKLELGYEGYNEAQTDTIMNLEEQVRASENYNRRMDEQAQLLSDVEEAQRLTNAELTGGAKAARALELELKGLDATQAKQIANSEEVLRNQKEFKDGLVSSITNATSIKEAFTNMGDWMKDWLKEKIAHFAANKIMAFVDSNTGGIQNLLAGGGQASGAGGFLGIAASVAGMAAAANSLGQQFGEVTGGNARNAGIGAVLGGPLGAVIGSATGSSWQDVAKGVEVGMTNGNFFGRDFTLAERERGLWGGTQQSYQFSDLNSGTAGQVASYFEELNNVVDTQLQAFGSELSAKDVMGLLNLDTIKISGENAQEEFATWLEGATSQAYVGMFRTLSNQTQAYIEEFTGAAEDADPQALIDTMTRVAESMNAVNQVAQMLNLQYDAASPLAAAAADNLVLLMGGVENLVSASAAYYQEFFTDEERKQRELQAAAAAVQVFNEGLEASGIAAINTKDEMRRYVESLDQMTVSGQEAFAQAMNVAGALDSLVDAETTAKEVIDTLPQDLKKSFEQMKVNAQEAYDAIVEKSRELNGASGQVIGQLTGLAQAERTLARETERAAAQTQRMVALMRQVGNTRFNLGGVGQRAQGSFRSGIANIPFDNFRAVLHKNERVLTARENAMLSNPAANTGRVVDTTVNNNMANKLDKVVNVLQQMKEDGRNNSSRTLNAFSDLQDATNSQTETSKMNAEANDRLAREIRRRSV